MGHVFFDLLNELDAAHVHYVLSRHQPDSVMVTITLVGERLEAVEGGTDSLRRLVRENAG